VNLNDWVEQERSVNIISLFCTFVYLKKFFSPEVIQPLRQTTSIKRLNSDTIEGALNGLKLATVAVLDGYVANVVDRPDLLGLEPDDDYYDYTVSSCHHTLPLQSK